MLTTIWFFLQLLIWFFISFSIWWFIFKNKYNIEKIISSNVYDCIFIFDMFVWLFLYASIVTCLLSTISFVELELVFHYKSDLIQINQINQYSSIFTYWLIQPYYWIIIQFGVNVLINFVISFNMLNKIISKTKYSVGEYVGIFINNLRQINKMWMIYGFIIWQFNSFDIIYSTIIIISCIACYVDSNLSMKIQEIIYDQTKKCIKFFENEK